MIHRHCYLFLLLGVTASPVLAQRPSGREGSRRGFDPGSFLERLDRNNNGMLDPDEQEGPGQFLIRRLESFDSGIKGGKPIPLSKLKDAFEKMRSNGGRGDRRGRDGRDRNNDRDRSSSRGEERQREEDALKAELLVPGFGEEETSLSPQGFGATAELLASKVTDADRAEAARRMKQFDRNKDGFLAGREITRQFSGNPMDFDRNRDQRLSVDELAVRYARRREAAAEDKKKKSQDDRRNRNRDRDSSDDDANLFNGRKSYRSTGRSRTKEGIPGFFTDKDTNQDGQVTMAEYAQDWDDETLAKFYDSDFNQDGVITADEALRMVEEGTVSSLMGSNTDRASANDSSVSNSSDGNSRNANSARSKTNSSGSQSVDPRHLAIAKRIIGRRDTNKDGVLTPSEWKSMLISPAAADLNRDGKITAQEYAIWTRSRERGR